MDPAVSLLWHRSLRRTLVRHNFQRRSTLHLYIFIATNTCVKLLLHNFLFVENQSLNFFCRVCTDIIIIRNIILQSFPGLIALTKFSYTGICKMLCTDRF